MAKQPLLYTFGNHMHWVDMQWLWGYDVLPGSVDDMLRLARETGAKGCVNFDVVGYEKMAADSPDALERLRAAVAAGTVEPVGCSYGQPYGLFHGGESNVRQFMYGVRATRRLLGVRPRTFWEEEFYFFPQLPQILTQCKYDAACLFFQWTWHTPELPRESAALIEWEGCDGSRIAALPRNGLNVHQWPEDFDGLLDGGLVKELPVPAVVQWLELMPSPDWMCRSEVLLPRLKQLLTDPRFDVQAGTVNELVKTLRARGGEIPVRRYDMHQVWHGMTPGKNGDRHLRTSRQLERLIQSGEGLSTLAALLGRPYASWDVYPTWELDEAWRELLAAQHHDNHECEGLCGFVGYAGMGRGGNLAGEVVERTTRHLLRRLTPAGPIERNQVKPHLVAFNPLPMARDLVVRDPQTQVSALIKNVPPCGYRAVPSGAAELRGHDKVRGMQDAKTITLTRGAISVTVDRARGVITQITSATRPGGWLRADAPLLNLAMMVNGKPERFERAAVQLQAPNNASASIAIRRASARNEIIDFNVGIDESTDAVVVAMACEQLPRPDAGLNAGLMMAIAPDFAEAKFVTDTAYAIEEALPGVGGKRKYPTGDWMTSPQWFEDVREPITGLSFFDVLDAGDGRNRSDVGGAGLLVLHDGSQQAFTVRREGRVAGLGLLLHAYDPWDEQRPMPRNHRALYAFIPHEGMTHARRATHAQTFGAPNMAAVAPLLAPGTPGALGALDVRSEDGVVCTAIFRESAKAGEHLPEWAGHALAQASDGRCTHPTVLRLVEFNNRPGKARVVVPGAIAMAFRTTVLGETIKPLRVESDVQPPAWYQGAVGGAAVGGNAGASFAPTTWSMVEVELRPREIATIMIDHVPSRKIFRDLDAKREVWATIHKQPDAEDSDRGGIGSH